METLLRHQRKRHLHDTLAFMDDATADILEKKVHPYRPPGAENNVPSSISRGLDETGINVLVDPIKSSDAEQNALSFNGINNIPAKGPYFDVRRSKNVTALKGVTANLVCRVRRLGNHTVCIRLKYIVSSD